MDTKAWKSEGCMKSVLAHMCRRGGDIIRLKLADLHIDTCLEDEIVDVMPARGDLQLEQI